MALTWVCVSTPLLVAFAFLVLVMLSGSSPNLKQESRYHGSEQPAEAPHGLLSYSPDLTGGQWQDVMGFLGVECAAPGGKLFLCTSNQSK